jgi:hypothetical protein
MRTATIVSLICMAGALSGCDYNAGPGKSVSFVASNSDSVLLDFSARAPGELAVANDTAVQQCQIFNRRTAVLESLNVRSDSTIRATYLCRSPDMQADAGTAMHRRQ